MKLLKKLFRTFLIILILTIGILIYSGYYMYKEAVEKVDIETKIQEIEKSENYTSFEDLPEHYINAVIDTEDHRFYEHNGIDIISIFRAVITNIKEKEIKEGGSTITQQLAKNMYFTQEQKLVRKIAELFVVYDLEKNYIKEDIFALYANTSYFGDGYYGIGKASDGYFNKSPSEMTIYECTLIAGIPNAPSIYAPTKNLELARKRQIHVINRMVKKGHLTSEEADSVLSRINN